MRTRVVMMRELGDETVLVPEDVDLPDPGPGEVVLRVLAVSVNHLDLELRDGRSRMPLTFPHVLGREVVGEVVETGPGAGGWTTGDRVVLLPHVPCGGCRHCLTGSANICLNGWMPGIHGWGGYAEHMIAPARGLLRAPDLPVETIAAVPISFGTAWRALESVARITPGEWVLVAGAGGALGHAAVQVAALAGARPIALVRDDNKAEFARSCGAEHVVVTGETDWVDQVRTLTDHRGVDAVVEHVGGASFEGCLAALAPRGRLVVAGGHGGEHPRIDVIETFRNEWQVLGVRSQRPDDVERVLGLVEQGRLRPHVDSVLPLERAAEAHRRIESRQATGKVVLVP
ncbi:zinc-binding dehydrogenase [Nocardioides sp. R-C-SC26]|uniref:zinc-binding dehydrogenase n=1 Tax=Nocardioides sp. R-C-SC26 TaxID=2870414 RepID=UPI001E3C13BD|nr:zinc-binding dehydrogenase [Nocardioides sp. R-C-SC26]